MRTLYGVASWLLLAFGLVHIAATPSRFDTLTSGALWFLSGGVLLVVVASLNLLKRAYGVAAPGVRRVALRDSRVGHSAGDSRTTCGSFCSSPRLWRWGIVECRLTSA